MRKALDINSLRGHVGPGSDWAVENGGRVKARREQLSLTARQVAQFCDIPVQTIYRVESGKVVPRDYIRAAIAHVLCCEVGDLFLPPDRDFIAGFMDEAAA